MQTGSFDYRASKEPSRNHIAIPGFWWTSSTHFSSEHVKKQKNKFIIFSSALKWWESVCQKTVSVSNGLLAALVFSPVVLLWSPVENRPVCQTHALYGNREMWASGERCSYFKLKCSLLLFEALFHPWYGHKGVFPLLWQKMWSRTAQCLWHSLSQPVRRQVTNFSWTEQALAL